MIEKNRNGENRKRERKIKERKIVMKERKKDKKDKG